MQTKSQIKETTKKASMFWLKSQVAAGKTESEIKRLFSLEETRNEILTSAKRLAV